MPRVAVKGLTLTTPVLPALRVPSRARVSAVTARVLPFPAVTLAPGFTVRARALRVTSPALRAPPAVRAPALTARGARLVVRTSPRVRAPRPDR
jgi:hypothetical protein